MWRRLGRFGIGCGWRFRFIEPALRAASTWAGRNLKASSGWTRLFGYLDRGIVVELSGNRPPSPNRRTNAFFRLSFEFVLRRPTPRNRASRGSSSLNFG